MTADPFVGRKVLGRYRIVQSIGRGGMGLIYLARHEGAAGFVKPVVVKRAAPEALAKEPTLREIMGREARIMTHLHHPAIVSVTDFAEEDGAYLLVLDYVHGFHLGQWQRFMRSSGRPFPVDLAIYSVCKVLDALQYAHTVLGPDGKPLGIVHRDVSPSNVLLDVAGHVKLADFGIARMHSDQTEAATQGSLLKGKFAYMAPELITHAPPNAQTDLYAAGVVLHELLIGRNELRVADSVEATIGRIIQHVPSRVSEVCPDAPAGLDEVVAKALAKNRNERYADAAEFAHALRELVAPEEELERKLTAAIGVDFHDPRMPQFLGVLDLATLDKAWRELPSEMDIDVILDVHSTAPPKPDSSREREKEKETVRPPTRSSNAALWVAIGGIVAFLCLVAAGGVYAFVHRNDGTTPPPNIFVVPEPSTPDVPEAGTAAPPTSTAPVSPPASVKTGTPAVGTVAPHVLALGGVTQTFKTQQPALDRCFDANAAGLSGAPEIAIRFEVDPTGHVTSAQVFPTAIASTPLGECLAGVARGTKFGAQPQAVAFRIPINVASRKKQATP